MRRARPGGECAPWSRYRHRRPGAVRRYAREDVENLYQELQVTPRGAEPGADPTDAGEVRRNRIGYRTEGGPGAQLRRAFITPSA